MPILSINSNTDSSSFQVIPSITFWSTLSPLSKAAAAGADSAEKQESSGDAPKTPESPGNAEDRKKQNTIFQFPTLVNGQMTFAGVPVRPIAAALGQPIPADQVNNVASQLTSHMSNVSSPINLMSPSAMAAKLSSNT